MKKMLAIAAAAATVMSAGSVFAADRLSDTEMDTVSAGFLDFNFARVRQTNFNASPATSVAIGIGGGALSGAATLNGQTNNTTIIQANI